MEIKVAVTDATQLETPAIVVNLFQAVTMPGGVTAVR